MTVKTLLQLAPMHPGVRQALQQRRFFKLICGASYRNTDFISELAYIFASAGAQVIDVGARPELVKSALAGIARAEVPVAGLPLVMVSVGINSDLHFLRVEKEHSLCTDHGYCANACPHEVFVGSEIRLQNCLGCDHCVIACPEKALRLVAREPMAELHGLLEACFEAGASAIEVHTGDGGRAELEQLLQLMSPWQERIELLAFSMGAHGQERSEIVALAQDVIECVGTEIIIQADGKPISGRKGAKSTLPCLELAQEMFASGLEAFVQVSGGTNDLTGQLAQELKIPIHGVGMGSFARKYLKLSPTDVLDEQSRRAVVEDARSLVNSVAPVTA